MKRTTTILTSVAACGAFLLFAQETARPPATRATVERGHVFFADNCGICHGEDAKGGDRGPNLTTGQFKHGSSDADVFRTITHGVPGTIMPANDLPADQVWAIIVFLRSNVVASRSAISGDREAGEKYFWNAGKCGDCHMVKGKGGVLGPDLSQIGGTRTVQYLTEKLRDPNKEVTSGLREPNADYVVPIANATVTAVTKTGQRITGVPKNEDTFSLQMLGADNEIHVFLKSDIKDVLHTQKSLMPAYSSQELSGGALQDLLSYLATLQ